MLLLHSRQCFPIESLSDFENIPIAIIEDLEHFRSFRFHKQKLILELAAARGYAETLSKKGFDVTFAKLSGKQKEPTFEEKLKAIITSKNIKRLIHFEIENIELEERIAKFCKQNKISLEVRPSPIFMTKRKEFETYLKNVKESNGRPMIRTFYTERRKKLKILVDKKGEPAGGQFTYENLNNLRLAREIRPPEPPHFSPSEHVQEATQIVGDLFKDHPGQIDKFDWPVTREQALSALGLFVKQRLARFGDYADSLASHSDFIFHSGLSTCLNLGLITPTEVIHQVLEAANTMDIPIQSLENFIHQCLGWREFVRGMYLNFGDELPESNFWEHSRKLKDCWYTGTTGLPFLDEAIKKALRLGYNHHIERLMILSNVMLLCEVAPQESYRWFMQMQVDAEPWVTIPNVFGLGQYADGGLVSMRPYVCGSAYIRKMSHQADGAWCDILDGLYWSFVERHSKVFAQNPRIAVALPALRKLDPDRKKKIFADAARFKDQVTTL
jgi:deoxyribodipyrimidine photolyase-related protein